MDDDERAEKAPSRALLWYRRNRDKVNAARAEAYARDPEKFKEAAKLWRETNPKKAVESALKWRSGDIENVRAVWVRSAKKRRSTTKGRLEDSVSSGLHRGIVNGSKAGRRTFDLLGYTVDELRRHLEAKFQDGMTWDNYGPVWHIDHILPLSLFEYSTPDCAGFKAAWALANLQPLWARENISKGGRLDHPSQRALLAA